VVSDDEGSCTILVAGELQDENMIAMVAAMLANCVAIIFILIVKYKEFKIRIISHEIVI
jgi:predicted signal transduction protein with EAL and GGDEF domain